MLEKRSQKTIVAATLATIMVLAFQLSQSTPAYASGNDHFGVKEVYPTKQGGNEWYVNMDNPRDDPSFKNLDNVRFSQNSDGSWRVSADQIRMEAWSPANEKWQNVEITEYAKMVGGSNELLQMYSRGGHHTDRDQCLGSAYKSRLYGNGVAAWNKEITHPAYAGNRGETQAAGSLEGKWIGFKAVIYNIVENGKTHVRLESYVDDDVTDSNGNLVIKNNWKLASVVEDKGGWATHDSDFNSSCGRERDEILTGPGGTSSQNIAAFRSDGLTWDFKYLSVREIDPVQQLTEEQPILPGVSETQIEPETSQPTDTACIDDCVEVGQHIPNSKATDIQSVDVTLKKSSTATSGTVTVQIVQDGKVLGSKAISLSQISRQFARVHVDFGDPVKVAAKNFDVAIVYQGNGDGVYAMTQPNNVPGNYFVSTIEQPQYDMVLSINGGTTTSSSGSNTDTNNNQNTNTQTPAATGTVVLSLTAKRSEDGTTEIKGMHFAVWKGMTKIGDGFTGQQSVQVKSGETYDIYATLAYQQISFVKWADTQSTNNLRTEQITADKTFTVLYSGAPAASTSGTEGTGGTGGSGGTGSTGGTGGTGGTGSTGGDSGGTTTAGANQVAVKSQLLDGTSKTGMAVELREAANGNIAQNSFTPATLDMQPGIEYKAIVYPFEDYFFRHWTDGGLHRYHLVDTAHNSGDTLTAQYEQVPASISAHLMINAKTSSGQPIGGTTGSEEKRDLNAEPGLEVLVAPPGSMNAYTAGFTGGSEIADAFHFAKGKTYTVIAQEFGQYKFSHWEDNNSTNRARAVPLNGDLTLTAIYDVVG